MKKLIASISALLLALLFATPSFAAGPLPAGSFGIGASMSGPTSNGTGVAVAPRGEILYTLSPELQLDLGVGFQSINDDASDETATGYSISVGAKYFLGTVPFVGGEFIYAGSDDSFSSNSETNTYFAINALLGAQSFITKSLALYGYVGAGYSQLKNGATDDKVSRFGLNTAAVGASFYFGAE